MKLLALQRALQAHILNSTDDIEAELDTARGIDVRRRLHVYHHAYRARLGGVLREAFDRTWSWLGDEAFDAAVTAYIATTPSNSPSLDDYAAGFAAFLAHHLPEDVEACELAWLERAMRHVFDGPDAEPVDPAALAKLDAHDWERARFRLHPTLVLREVRSHVGSLWAGIEAGEPFTPTPVGDPLAVRVWRKGLQPHFRMIEVEEKDALFQLTGGASFSSLCEALARSAGDDPVERAARLLAVWLQDQLIVGVDT